MHLKKTLIYFVWDLSEWILVNASVGGIPVSMEVDIGHAVYIMMSLKEQQELFPHAQFQSASNALHTHIHRFF